MKILIISIASIFLSACNKKEAPKPPAADPCFYNGVDTCALNAALKLNIRLNEERQVIHSFGSSDAWTTKFIGNWSDVSKRNRIADYLFSLDTLTNGSPIGIGLSQWRFYIGAGSLEQGAASGIPDEWRREECFLNPNGTYDWSKQSGAQWFLNAAKARNVRYFTGFSCSPPVQMTKDGRAHGAGGTTLNIATGKLPDFATFLRTVSARFNFDYISPFNEPQWNWGASPSQEGTAATNTEIAALTRLLGTQLQTNAVNTKIVIGEAAQLNHMTEPYGTDRGDQVYNWFSSASPNFVGNVPNMEKVITGHSYFTTCPDNNLINVRTALHNKRNSIDASLGIWQTEFGILMDICGKYNGYPKNTGIDYGLYVEKVIHHDLTFANVSSWSWWLSVSPYDYSDALVYVTDPTGNINITNSKNDGIVSDSKQLWCMGNFSRFVRPGMKRVNASISGIDDLNAANSFMVSAYKDEATKKIVFVIINMNSNSKKFTIDGLGTSINLVGNRLDTYTTTGSKNLAKSSVSANNITIEGKSVTTLIGTYN